MQVVQEIGKQEFWMVDEGSVEMVQSSKLGEGGFGQVFQGRYWHAAVAVKIPAVDNSGQDLGDLLRELRILRRVRHPNAVFFFGAFFDAGGRLHLVEELIDGSTLANMVELWGPSSKHGIDALVSVCSVLTYLHSLEPAIVHGDLKPQNVIIESRTFKARVIDFGLSCFVKPTSKYRGKSRSWSAPEVLAGQRASTASDVFSVGFISFFVVTGTKPMPMPDEELPRLARQDTMHDLLTWPAEAARFQTECRKLCSSCLAFNPMDRADAESLLHDLLAWNKVVHL